MRPMMEDLSFGGMPIVGPLPFNMNERPLSAAEGKMLNARHHEEIVFIHIFLITLTPSGIMRSSISTL